ncbi:hypothetical protein FM111_06950 [Brevundimonas diminuta 3F5N]|uniref:Uncharacterized protein n=1 Tax=Brevundimonas diminuta 3F5N TaxID=1255603 RepID=A0A1R4FT64_BREDI|nr:hypothetical protein FM111_06950 [Brevundimonas diminuta 3F5N]
MGEGGRRSLTDEGFYNRILIVPFDRGETPHPTRCAGHLLPQGEKDRRTTLSQPPATA